MGTRARDRNLLGSGLATLGWDLDVHLVGEIASRQRLRNLLDLFVGSIADDFPPAFAGPRSEVEDMIRSAHDVRIMLHHQDRIPEIPQPVQDFDQTVGVTTVQADRRLVQNVERADKT